jgi:nucleoside-diphosphate-sugar epimerase
MMRVVVTGAAGSIGRRVVDRISGRDDMTVLAVDRAPLPGAFPGVTAKVLDLADADLASVFAGADAVVHLAATMGAGSTQPAEADLELAVTRRILDAMAGTDARHLVIMSSAMVYGAWPANPVPLTEEAAVRPNPDFAWAQQRARIERLAQEWRAHHNGAALSILRPTAVVTDASLGQLAQTLRAARTGVAAEGDPPVQYLHGDDLADAVVVCLTGRYDGVVNVAPDGWIPPDRLAALEGPTARVRVPVWAARLVSNLRWRFGLAPTPPGVVPYTTSSWVVSNDRLRALGWRAGYSNEEAWVVSHDPNPLERIPAGRRQQIALVVAVVAIVGMAVGAGFVVVRMRRRRGPLIRG